MQERGDFLLAEPSTFAPRMKRRLDIPCARRLVAVRAHELDVGDLLRLVVPFASRGLKRFLAEVTPRVGPLVSGIVDAGVITACNSMRDVSTRERARRLAVRTAGDQLAVAHRGWIQRNVR